MRAVGATIVNRVKDLPDRVHDPESVPYTPPRTARGYPERHRPHVADVMSFACNVFNLTLVPASGAVEMAISVGLHARARAVTGVEAGPFRAVADALEVIPRTLVQNAGGNVIRALTALRAKHANGEHSWGIDGETGDIVDMKTYKLYESASVKIQTLKTAIEAARVLLRVDDVVQATRKERRQEQGAPPEEPVQD